MKRLVFADRAKNDLASLDFATRLRVVAAIQRLAFHNAGNIKKLQGMSFASPSAIGVFVLPAPTPIRPHQPGPESQGCLPLVSETAPLILC